MTLVSGLFASAPIVKLVLGKTVMCANSRAYIAGELRALLGNAISVSDIAALIDDIAQMARCSRVRCSTAAVTGNTMTIRVVFIDAEHSANNTVRVHVVAFNVAAMLPQKFEAVNIDKKNAARGPMGLGRLFARRVVEPATAYVQRGPTADEIAQAADALRAGVVTDVVHDQRCLGIRC